MILFLVYMNELNGAIFTFLNDFIILDIEFIKYIIKEKKSLFNFNTLSRRYEYETNIMKYIGYLLINDKYSNDEDHELYNFYYGDNKVFCMDDIYMLLNYNELEIHCKKNSLFYKLLVLKKYYIFSKLSKDIVYRIYEKIYKKYYELSSNKLINILDNYI